MVSAAPQRQGTGDGTNQQLAEDEPSAGTDARVHLDVTCSNRIPLDHLVELCESRQETLYTCSYGWLELRQPRRNRIDPLCHTNTLG